MAFWDGNFQGIQVNQLPPADGGEIARLNQVLNENKNLNFVQRILDPENSPHIRLGEGTWGTHLMSSASIGDKFIVYPEIVQAEDGSLKRLDRKEAMDYAVKNKEYIKFDTAQEAEWFGANYKKVWKGKAINNQVWGK